MVKLFFLNFNETNKPETARFTLCATSFRYEKMFTFFEGFWAFANDLVFAPELTRFDFVVRIEAVR